MIKEINLRKSDKKIFYTTVVKGWSWWNSGVGGDIVGTSSCRHFYTAFAHNRHLLPFKANFIQSL